MGIYVDKVSGHQITGAGILIVEEYWTMHNKKSYTVLVAQNRASNSLCDFGGGYEALKHSDIRNTASAELLEESRNLIDIEADDLKNTKYFDIIASESKRDYYRVYVIKANNIASKYFNYNKKIIDSNSLSKRAWKETSSIHHIPLDSIDFERILDHKSVYLTDVRGVKSKAHMRLRKILANVGRDNLIDIIENTKPAVTKNDLIMEDGAYILSGADFTKGTYVFRSSTRVSKLKKRTVKKTNHKELQ